MKAKSLSISVFLFAFMIICVANTVWAIPSDYSVTSNWHGVNTPIGSTVIVTAVTTDSRVSKITFLWRQPITTRIVYIDVVPVAFNGTVYVATSTHVVLTAGDWGVQALFQGSLTTDMHASCSILWGDNFPLAIRATSFNVIPPNNQVPEAPTLGTVGAACAMSLGGGLYLWRKRKIGTI
jgi:hypothetical protein